MKLSFLQSIALAGLLGCCSGSQADATRSPASAAKPSLLPICSSVLVKEVIGQVEYAYDSTGWKPLLPGKTLRAGATIRAAADSQAILRVAGSASFFKVSASTAVHITHEPPLEELGAVTLAALEHGHARTVAAD